MPAGAPWRWTARSPRRPGGRPREQQDGQERRHQSTPLVDGTAPPARGSIAHGLAQRPGDGLELRLHHVVRVRVAARPGRPQHVDVQRHLGRVAERLEDVPGHAGRVDRARCTARAAARRAPRTAGRTGRRRPARAPRPSAPCALPYRRMPALSPSASANAAPSASAVSSIVWCASISQVALRAARSGRSRRAGRAGRACGRRSRRRWRSRPGRCRRGRSRRRPWSPWCTARRGSARRAHGSCLARRNASVSSGVPAVTRSQPGEARRRGPARRGRAAPARPPSGRRHRSRRATKLASLSATRYPRPRSVATIRSRCSLIASTVRSRAGALASAARAAAWVSEDRWYGQPDELHRVDDGRVGGEVADPPAGEAERLAHRAGDDEPRVAGQHGQRAAACPAGRTRRTPRRRPPCPAPRRAPRRRPRGAAPYRSGCSASRGRRRRAGAPAPGRPRASGASSKSPSRAPVHPRRCRCRRRAAGASSTTGRSPAPCAPGRRTPGAAAAGSRWSRWPPTRSRSVRPCPR